MSILDTFDALFALLTQSLDWGASVQAIVAGGPAVAAMAGNEELRTSRKRGNFPPDRAIVGRHTHGRPAG
jgi:hypothetical protein